jgi:hypothetical protein
LRRGKDAFEEDAAGEKRILHINLTEGDNWERPRFDIYSGS